MNIALGTLPKELADLAKEWPLVFMFDLPPKANIVVVGCYEGKSMDLLRNVYPDYGKLMGYDLQYPAVVKANTRFSYADHVYINAFGLGTTTTYGKVKPAEYGSVNTTLVSRDANAPECDLVPADHALSQAFTVKEKIDLMVMNIEGFEIELLSYFKHTDWLKRIERLAVQFHPNIINPTQQYLGFNKQTTHKLVVDQFPQWVYWKKV